MQITAQNSRPRTNYRNESCRVLGCRAEPPSTLDGSWHTVLIGGTIGSEAGVLTDTRIAAGSSRMEAEQNALLRAAKWGVAWLRETAETQGGE